MILLINNKKIFIIYKLNNKRFKIENNKNAITQV